MMTWFPNMSLFDSAEALALPQLALAAKESEALFLEMVYDEPNEDFGAAPRPLVLMWQGYEIALAGYSVACSATLVQHGVTNSQSALDIAKVVEDLRRGGDPATMDMPPWLSDIDVLRSHRSNLMRRFPQHYNWRRTPTDMPYLWPAVDDDGGYRLLLSKHDKNLLAAGERTLPKNVMERIDNA